MAEYIDYEQNQVEQRLKLIRRLAWLLDSSIKIPNTRIRIGWDAILGLIPGIGDFIGLITGLIIVGWAIKMRISLATVLRMLTNIGIESLVGCIPIIGDAFDFFWKAHERNLKLLERSLSQPNMARKDGRYLIGLLTVVFVAGLLIVSLSVALTIWLLQWLWTALAGWF